MAQNRQQQQRGQQQGGQRPAARPWNVFYPRTYSVGGGNSGQPEETRTDFMRVGTAFPLTNKQGFSIEVQLPLMLSPGERLIMMPRDDDAERDGRA